MFRQLLKFETQLHTRQVGFWIAFAIMFALGLLLASVDWFSLSMEGGSKIKNNGAIPLAGEISFVSMFCIFFGAVFVVTGVMRDDNHKMLELVHSTPVKTSSMFISRMLGAWLATFLCVLAWVVGMMFGQLVPWADAETFGPFNPLFYLHPLVVFVLVNTLFVSGFYTAIAMITRNKALVYVSAVGLLTFYLASTLAGAEAPEWLSSMLDPFGTTALANVVEFWPAAEQNTSLTPLGGHVGVNRLLWLAIGGGLFALSFILSTRGIVFRKTKKHVDNYVPTGKVNLAPVTPQLGFNHDIKTFAQRFKFEYLTTVRSTAFLILIGIAIVLFGVSLAYQVFFDSQKQLYTSTRMVQLALGSLAIPMIIVMVFFGGEIMWRDRVANMHTILDATPARDWTLLAAKWLSLVAAVLTVIGAAALVSMIVQLAMTQGEIPVVGTTYFRIALLTFGLTFAFQTLLVMFIQNFAPNRIIGMLAGAAILIGVVGFIGLLPFFHPLMAFGSVSPGAYSEMAGFSGVTRAKWFGLYWSAFVVFLGVLSVWIWRRGLQAGLLQRLRNLPSRITPITGGLAALALAGFIGTGTYIYNAYDAGEYRNRKQNELRQVAAEKLIKPILDAKEPMPKIIAVEADVDFYPARRDAVVRGSYILENQTGKPVERLFVNPPSAHEEDVKTLTLAGATENTASDLAKDMAEYDVRIFEFNPPMAPGATAKMTFETYYHPPRLGDGSAIRSNGTFVNNFNTMPQLGLSDGIFLRNPDKRRKYELGERKKNSERTDKEAIARNLFGGTADYVDFKARVCTDQGQIPIAPGKFEGETIEGDRICRKYEAINPILNFFNFMSAEYEVSEDVWNNPNGDDVDLKVYYHPGHDFNVELMLQAMKDSFDTFTTTFGPYQYAQLRVMEFPYASFAQAFAGTVPFSENIGFVMDPGDPENNKNIDFATYVTMHEIGHQWFAHQVVPADVLGSNFMSEGLTENAAILAYRNKFGYQKMRRMLDTRFIQQYLVFRTVDKDDEPPLAKAENQQYLDYMKAGWVFWGLGYYVGEDNLQSAIRDLVEDFGGKGPPYATSLDLVERLKEFSDPDYHQLIDDYFERITFWDLGFDKDTNGGDILIKKVGNEYELTIPITVDKKLASEEDGEETSVNKMDDEVFAEWVEIGVYNEDPKEKLGDEWLALERIRITTDNSKAAPSDEDDDAENDKTYRRYTATIRVKEKPTHVLIDPRRLLIERNVDDNGKEVVQKVASN